MKKSLVLGFALLTVAGASSAQSVYGGVGLGGVTLGYSHSVTPNIAVRADWTGGLSLSRNGLREGVDYSGKFKMNRVGAYGDYFPTGTGFRLTGGVTFNDTSVKLSSRAGRATIGSQTVDLANDLFFNVEVKQPDVTPYLGIGYGERPDSGKGWGWYADLGVQLGKFKVNTSTNVVGVAGIQQTDVDAETASVRDNINKLKALPVVQFGVSYRF